MQQINLQRFAATFAILLLLPHYVVVQDRVQVEIKPGPSSGIIIQEAPGLIMTERRIVSQTIYVDLDPELAILKSLGGLKKMSEELTQWYNNHIRRTRDSVTKILEQLKKTFIAKDDIQMPRQRGSRQRRFAGVLVGLAALTVVGLIVGSTVSTVNALSIKKVSEHTQDLRGSLVEIQQQLRDQYELSDEIIRVINSTVVIQNQQTLQMMHSTQLLESFEQRYVDQMDFIDPINFSTQEFLREFQNSISNLIRAQIPLYFITVDKVKQILRQVHHLEVEDLQVRVALEMGSAITMFIDVNNMHLSFLMQLPLVLAERIYQTKKVFNVGTWRNDTYMKIKAPEILAYQNWTDGDVLVPKLETCLLFKDLNFLCPGKPFLPDAAGALCGIQQEGAHQKLCDMMISRPSIDELNTVTTLIQDQWLVSTRLLNMTVTNTLHGTFKVVPLPSPVSIIKVPKDLVVTIGDQNLFHVPNMVLDGKLELVNSFPSHEVQLNKDLEYLIQHKSDHVVQLAITDESIKVHKPHFSVMDYQIINQKNDTQVQMYVFLATVLALITWLAVMTMATWANTRHRTRMECLQKFKVAIERAAQATPML